MLFDKHEITAIHRLHTLLEGANIPHDYIDRSEYLGTFSDIDWGYQIIVYQPNGDRLVSVVEGYGTYGYEADLLEIQGLLTEEERERDNVAGWLSVGDVFGRIKANRRS